jgi:hypothetical protein
MTVQVDWGNLLVIPIALLLALIPVLVGILRSRKERSFMLRISQALGFTYQERGDVASTQAQGLAGGQISDVISGAHSGVAVGAFTYRVLTGGKNKYWSYMTVFETPVRATLPDIVLQPNELTLDAAANIALSRTSFLGKYEKVPLEGNFDKYFTLYVAKGAHIEALEIFAPDTMADMIDHFQSYGLEFSNDTLYLYPMKLIKDDATFMQALSLLERLATNLAPTLDAMATSEVPQQEAAPST